MAETNNAAPEVEDKDELSGLIRETLEERVAGAQSRQTRESMLAVVRASERDQELQEAALQEGGFAEGEAHLTGQPVRTANLGQALSQLTGQIIGLVR